jgi:uncharacterized protein (DUF1501 family)
MNDPLRDRREFLTSGLRGIGALALAALLAEDGLLAAEPDTGAESDPLRPRPTHHASKARNCIFFLMAGGPSHVDLFDPKPELNRLEGQAIPESILKDAQFAFAQKETARLKGTPFRFRNQGQSGIEFSELLPHLSTCVDDIALIRSMHTDTFNHRPALNMMNTGFTRIGRPSLGSWLLYGLGSVSRSLPGYVVLNHAEGLDGGTSNWSSGFLPSSYQGVPLRTKGPAVLNLNNPDGLIPSAHRLSLDAAARLNRERFTNCADPEILSRIANYEQAFRMQSAAPELNQVSAESRHTLDLYGLNRPDPLERSFAKSCLLARRLVERGVRFVQIYHEDWDAHIDLVGNHTLNCRVVDQPIAALLKDLKRRGLLDSTLVVFAGEFGRTPIGENRPQRTEVSGRDHHPSAFSVWMAGGGIKGGQVIGKTDEIGWNPIEDPVHVNDFHATMLHLFGIDHRRLTYRFQGRDFRLTDVGGVIVEKLFG